jgi:hypothetical protein
VKVPGYRLDGTQLDAQRGELLFRCEHRLWTRRAVRTTLAPALRESEPLDGGTDGAGRATEFSRDLLGAAILDDRTLDHPRPVIELGKRRRHGGDGCGSSRARVESCRGSRHRRDTGGPRQPEPSGQIVAGHVSLGVF